MAIDETFVKGEGWTLTFSLYDADDNLVPADTLKLVLEPYNKGSDFALLTYVSGSDAEITNSASGVYVFEDAALEPNVYLAEWQADGTNKERKRTTFRIKEEL